MAASRATELAFDAALKWSKDRNIPLLEVLDQSGMLLTQEMTKHIVVKTLEGVYRRLEAQDPAKLLQVFTGRGHGTPDEMYRAILEWLEVLIKAYTDGEVQP